ncbi:MAG: hypothetical protein K0U38_07075 [Epsilonproteobacteria bacterium]|nr:hypothetical protein [Campylobacterota bacterium]
MKSFNLVILLIFLMGCGNSKQNSSTTLTEENHSLANEPTITVPSSNSEINQSTNTHTTTQSPITTETPIEETSTQSSYTNTTNYHIALDNYANEVKATFEGFQIVVYSDKNLLTDTTEEKSFSTKALFGKINGQNTTSLLKLNDNYTSSDKLIVKVHRGETLVGESSKITYIDDTVLQFSDITIP